MDLCTDLCTNSKLHFRLTNNGFSFVFISVQQDITQDVFNDDYVVSTTCVQTLFSSPSLHKCRFGAEYVVTKHRMPDSKYNDGLWNLH